MPDNIGKIPPQNIEAEQSVLGSMLIEEEAVSKVIDILDRNAFYYETHQDIFDVILDLFNKHKAIDLITVTEELKKRKLIEKIGGAGYLTTLINSVATAANVEHYARIVKEKAILRNLIYVSNQIINDCYRESEEVETILDKAQQNVFNISQKRENKGFINIKEMIPQTIETVESLYHKKRKVPGISSGFIELDRMTNGFFPGQFIIVAGRPSMGKTSFGLNIALSVGIKEKLAVGIFSLEMSKHELLMRLLCTEGRIDAHKIRSGTLSKRDWNALTNAASVLSEAPINIDDTPGISVLEIKSRARRLQAERGLGLIIIDYLQQMPGRTGRAEYRQIELSEISRALKIMAKELNVPVIAISQLSRETEKRKGKDKRPILSDLRDSGAIEQDADMVLFIYREEVYSRENTAPEFENIAEIIIGKQRNGPVGVVKLAFIKEYTRFENLLMEKKV